MGNNWYKKRHNVDDDDDDDGDSEYDSEYDDDSDDDVQILEKWLKLSLSESYVDINQETFTYLLQLPVDYKNFEQILKDMRRFPYDNNKDKTNYEIDTFLKVIEVKQPKEKSDDSDPDFNYLSVLNAKQLFFSDPRILCLYNMLRSYLQLDPVFGYPQDILYISSFIVQQCINPKHNYDSTRNLDVMNLFLRLLQSRKYNVRSLLPSDALIFNIKNNQTYEFIPFTSLNVIKSINIKISSLITTLFTIHKQNKINNNVYYFFNEKEIVKIWNFFFMYGWIVVYSILQILISQLNSSKEESVENLYKKLENLKINFEELHTKILFYVNL